MKTLEEFYTEVLGDEELKVAFAKATREGNIVTFLSDNGCDATQEEIEEFIGLKMAEDAPMELNLDQLADIVAASQITQTAFCSGDTCDCSDTCVEDCC